MVETIGILMAGGEGSRLDPLTRLSYTLVKYLEPERFKYLKEIKSIKEFDLKKNETFKIEKEKIGEDKQIERKPQNIIDFLKNG